MKNIYTLFLFFCFTSIFAQVGINTTNPQGTLDVVSTNNTGIVLPRVSAVEDVTDGNTNPPVNGTTVYDISRNTTCFYQNNRWVCISEDGVGNPILEVVDTNSFNDTNTIDYIKASNTEYQDYFAEAISLSGDGNTLAVAAYEEESCATGINGAQTNNGCRDTGAVYVFTRTGTTWSQQAYIKASNTRARDSFGQSISLSSDGNTLAVGASEEDKCATGINGDQTGNLCIGAGAVYVFTRSGTTWSQQAYVKASNTDLTDGFGQAISLSSDGNTLVIGTIYEDSCATGINGDDTNNGCAGSGAVYIFTRSGTTWSQQAYVKASNTDINDRFGEAVSLSSDGNTLAVGAYDEGSCVTGINGAQTNNGCIGAGAVYIFIRSGTAWSQQVYIKASNTDINDRFGGAVSLSYNGNTLAVGAYEEGSCATGINGDQTNNGCDNSGAAYVFTRSGTTWSQEAYIKPSTTRNFDNFGRRASLSSDGNTLAVGVVYEDSCATGINGDQTDYNGCGSSGAVYVYAGN